MVSELANEVQVILLTCHPTLVERVTESHDATFWTLSAGIIDGPHSTTDPVRAVLDRADPATQ